jgi:choline dehydrogenase
MDYDTIVVGAGSAGAVIAARLTEDPRRRVLLIEAGPHYASEPSTPADLLDGRRNSVSAHDWGFSYFPSDIRRPVPFPRGRVTGGSSAVNTCIALRGQPYDYDEWASLGCPEWSYKKCLPAFVRLETDLDKDGPIHGKTGPFPIRRAKPDELVPIQRAFLEACAELGFPECPDHNDPSTTGYGPHAMNRIGNKRVSTALAYLAGTADRPNLTVMDRTLVRRVEIRSGRAVGVEIERDGIAQSIACPRVVLSAGAIQTPAILIRSGVGPRHVLDRLGAPVILDLPSVGARLIDHPGALIALAPAPGAASFDHPVIQTTLRYSSRIALANGRANDMQLQPLSFIQIDNAPLLMAISTVVGKPKSVGRLDLESVDPRAQPILRPNLLGESDDVAMLADGIELAVRAAKTRPIAELGLLVWPDEQTLSTRPMLEQWLRENCGSGYHPVGTVPMGDPDDPSAATDQYGRLRGLSGLIIADASLMPTITSANTNLPTIMIGERVAEWLRDSLL